MPSNSEIMWFFELIRIWIQTAILEKDTELQRDGLEAK